MSVVHAWHGLAVGRAADRAHSWVISMLCSIIVQTGRAMKVKAGLGWGGFREKMGCSWARRMGRKSMNFACNAPSAFRGIS